MVAPRNTLNTVSKMMVGGPQSVKRRHQKRRGRVDVHLAECIATAALQSADRWSRKKATDDDAGHCGIPSQQAEPKEARDKDDERRRQSRLLHSAKAMNDIEQEQAEDQADMGEPPHHIEALEEDELVSGHAGSFLARTGQLRAV